VASVGLKDAFARYGATLRNVQWSVSAWTPAGELVVSLWEHHRRKGEPGSLEFADSADRWSGPGNKEFRDNLNKAFREQSRVRLIIVHTDEVARVEAGEDASKVKKEFFVRDDLIGQATEWDGTHFAFRFKRI
jgi:hypothetical protein